VVKRPRREVDHSSPPRAEVKNEWSYTFAPPICLHGVDRDNFAFTFYKCVGIQKQKREKARERLLHAVSSSHPDVALAVRTLTFFL
jgi:hypothetical protein